MRGAVSGMYEFSDSRPIQRVDTGDAPSLLSTVFFVALYDLARLPQ